MASLSKAEGGFRIQFQGNDGKRQGIWLPQVKRREAEQVRLYVESLLISQAHGTALPEATAEWLTKKIGDDLHAKLVKLGLCQPRQTQKLTLGEYLASWLEGKRTAGYASSSIISWGLVTAELTKLLGTRPVAELSHADAETYRAALLGTRKRTSKKGKERTGNLRPSTVNKRLTHARTMLEDAVRRGLIASNPFAFVRHRAGDPAERRAYVTVANAQRVIDAAPNAWWRLLIALARFAGLRTPSEPFSLTWADIDWANDRMTVSSPKGKASGKAYRVIPLFPLLKHHLEDARELATDGSIFVFPEEYRRRALGPNGFVNANLRTTLEKIVRRAKVEPWPRLWHSLRASCESDLAQSFPLATVTKWLGNTPSIAMKHYVDPTDVAFDQAKTWTPATVQRTVQSSSKANLQGNAGDSIEVRYRGPTTAEPPVFSGVLPTLADECSLVQCTKVEAQGLEPYANPHF